MFFVLSFLMSHKYIDKKDLIDSQATAFSFTSFQQPHIYNYS